MTQEKIIESVKNVYDDISLEFSASRQYLWPDLKPFTDQTKSGSSVLDVGCGNGRLLLGLPQKIDYTGLDISNNLLKEAQKRNPGKIFHLGDITNNTSWKNLALYDYIYCIGVIHHLPTLKDQIFVLKQMKRHLKPNGKIILTVWNLWHSKYLKYHLDPKTKLKNLHYVYIPFQGKPRFYFAFTTLYLKRLFRLTHFKLKIHKTTHNYLLTNE